MPTKESLQHKIDRVRPPRVQITYDVEVGGAIELKELPFVLGVMGDFVGKPEEAPGPSPQGRLPLAPRSFRSRMTSLFRRPPAPEPRMRIRMRMTFTIPSAFTSAFRDS